jgi:hypothetical protein
MPAKSQQQQKAAGMALMAKRGKIKSGKLWGSAKEMFKSMTADELRKFAKTKRKNLPKRVKDSLMAQEIFRNQNLTERDDTKSLKLGKAGFAYATLTSKDVLNQPKGVAKKVRKRYAMLRAVTNQTGIKGFPCMNKAEKVRHAIKDSQTKKIVALLLEDTE